MSLLGFTYGAGNSDDMRGRSTLGYQGNDQGMIDYFRRSSRRNDELEGQRQRERSAAYDQYQKDSNPLDPTLVQSMATNQPESAINWQQIQKDIYGG